MSTTLRTRLQRSRVFLLSSLSLEERREYGKIIQKLGGVYFDSESFKACCTHLICGRLSRSEKFLGALATGKWILQPEYIIACNDAEEWLSEAQFEWQPTYGRSDQSEKLIYAPMRWRLHFALEGEPAFKGWKVAVLVSDTKRALVYKRLLTSGGAKLYSLKLPVKDPMKVANTITFIFTDMQTLPQLLAMSFPDYGILLLKPDFIGDFLIQDPKPDPMDYILSTSSADKSLNSSQEINSSQLSVNAADSGPTSSQNFSVESLPQRETENNSCDTVQTYSECSQSSVESHRSVKPLVSTNSSSLSVNTKMRSQESETVKKEELPAPGKSLRNSRRILRTKQTSNVIQISSDSSPDCRKSNEQLIKVEKKNTLSEETDSQKSGHSVSQPCRRMSMRLKGSPLLYSVKDQICSQSQNSQKSKGINNLPPSNSSLDNFVTQSSKRTTRLSMRCVNEQQLTDNLECKTKIPIDDDSLGETEVQNQSDFEEVQSNLTKTIYTRSTRKKNEAENVVNRNSLPNLKKNCKSSQESRSSKRLSDQNVFSNKQLNVARKSKFIKLKSENKSEDSSATEETKDIDRETEINLKVAQGEKAITVEATLPASSAGVSDGDSAESTDTKNLQVILSEDDWSASREPVDDVQTPVATLPWSGPTPCQEDVNCDQMPSNALPLESKSASIVSMEVENCDQTSLNTLPSESKSASTSCMEVENCDQTSLNTLPSEFKSASTSCMEVENCDQTPISTLQSESKSASTSSHEVVNCDQMSSNTLPSGSNSTSTSSHEAANCDHMSVSTLPAGSNSTSSQETVNCGPAPVSDPSVTRTRSGSLRQIKSRRDRARLKQAARNSLLTSDKLKDKESAFRAPSEDRESDAQDSITVVDEDSDHSESLSKQELSGKLSQNSSAKNTTPTKLVQNSSGQLILLKLSPSPEKTSPRKLPQNSRQSNLSKISQSPYKAAQRKILSQLSGRSFLRNLPKSSSQPSARKLSQSPRKASLSQSPRKFSPRKLSQSLRRASLSQSPRKASPRKLSQSPRRASLRELSQSPWKASLSQSSRQSSPRKLSQSSLQDFGFSSANKRPTRRKLSQCLSRSSSCTGSPVSLSQGNRVCSQPESPRDCELNVFLPPRAEVLEDDVVYLREEAAPSASSESEHRPTPPTNSLKSVCPAKRKIFEDEKPTDTPPVKKRKMAQVLEPIRPWYPVSLGTNMLTHSHTDNTPSGSAVSRGLVPREIPTSVCHLISICVEEGFQKEALKMMQPYTGMCPSPHVLAILVNQVLLKAKTTYIAQGVHSVLMESLNHHPPTTKLVRDIYLTAFGMQNEEGVWAFVSSVISGAVSDSDAQDKHLLALQYILAVFRLDFVHFLNQCKSTNEKLGRCVYRTCMLVQCLWSPSYLMFSNLRTQTLLNLLEQALLLPKHIPHKRLVLECVLGFVSMAAQTCHIANSPTGGHQDIGERTTLFVRELSNRIIGSCIEDEATLVTTLKNLQPSWLCTKICQILLGHMDDFLLMVPPDDKCVTLTKIVSQYFFLLPRLSRADNGVKPTNSLPNKRTCRSKYSSSERTKAVEDVPDSDMAAKINKRNHLGETPLHTACIKNDVPRLKQLLTVPGVDVNAHDNAGWTPLHEACNKGHIDCVETLLQYVPARTVDSYFKKETSRRVDLMSTTPDGVTPLHDAVTNNRLDVCRLLLKHGGSELLKRQTRTGQCAQDLASTPSMQSLLTATPTPFKHRGEDLSSSQDSQNSPGPQHTSFLPSALLYEQVLAQSRRPMRASVADCCQYITMIQFLLQSYLRSSDILTHQRTGPTVHQSTHGTSDCRTKLSAPSKENQVPARRGRQTRRPVRLSAYVCGGGDNWCSIANTDSSEGDLDSRTELSDLETVKTDTEDDRRVLRKLRYHLKNFSLHISKITSEQDFHSLQTRLSSLGALAGCSKLLV